MPATRKKTYKRSPEEMDNIHALQKEIVNVLLKKTGVTLDDLYESARKRFVSSNLDLLTAAELKKYDQILLYSK
jgi:hypothetical protein